VHVIVFMFENENLGSAIGNKKAPYMSSIATECGYANDNSDDCFTTNLISLPHYLALTSGSNRRVSANSWVDPVEVASSRGKWSMPEAAWLSLPGKQDRALATASLIRRTRCVCRRCASDSCEARIRPLQPRP
jgi:hypothetical protein